MSRLVQTTMLTADDVRRLREIAEEQNKKTSAYIRDVLLDAIKEADSANDVGRNVFVEAWHVQLGLEKGPPERPADFWVELLSFFPGGLGVRMYQPAPGKPVPAKTADVDEVVAARKLKGLWLAGAEMWSVGRHFEAKTVSGEAFDLLFLKLPSVVAGGDAGGNG